jgi:hypothetical protein
MATSALLKSGLHTAIARGLFSEIQSKSTHYYYFLGKTLSWDNEADPLYPIESFKYDLETRNEIITMKEIKSTDVAFIVERYNWKDVNFEEFDLYNVGKLASCHSYFVSYQGASKILEHFDNIIITQAYDWELYKIKHINTKLIAEPLFIQTNEFVSNIAPNGYKLK